MRFWQRISIKGKLMVLSVLTSCAALLLACSAFFVFDLLTFRKTMIQNISAAGQIVGMNSASALVFNDPPAAANTLSALKARPMIYLAAIYDQSGNLFTTWQRDNQVDSIAKVLTAVTPQSSHRFLKNFMELYQPIFLDGDRIGTVYIKTSLNELSDRFKTYVGITIVVLILSFFVVVIISVKLGKKISAPILNLVKTATMISENKDYSVRVESQSQDEIGQLVRAFNLMLAQIKISGEQLQKSHDELEERVKQRTSQLETANKELEAFSYSVSHDLRAPLRSIDGFSLALLEDCGEQIDDAGKDHLRRIRASSQYMAQLIDDMLNLSRISRATITREPVNLSALGEVVTTELKRMHPHREVHLEIAPEMTTKGDARLLRIVLENLLSNAWKFTSKERDAKVEFSALPSTNGTRTYFVRDNGAGFDMAYGDKLFKPFQRLHTYADFAGTGVGLATVQRVVDKHGGRVWAESEPGKGATFYFVL